MNMGFGLVFGADTKSAESGIDRVLERLDKLNATAAEIGSEMSDVFEKAFGSLLKFGSGMISTAGEVEHATQMMAFAYRHDSEASAQNARDKISDASLYTMQTQKELTDMASNMRQVLDVDIFSDQMQAAFDKTKSTIQGGTAAVFADLQMAAYSNTGFNHALISLMNGNLKGAARFIPVIGAHMKDYAAAVAGAGTNTEKMARLMPLFVRDAGELTTYLMNTWPYMVHQIDDVKQKLAVTFGQGMMDELKKPLHEFLDYFTNPETGLLTSKNIGKLDGLKDAFKDIGHAVAVVAHWVGSLAKRVFEFFMAHPQLLKMVVAVTAFVGSFAGVVAVILAVKLAIAGVIAAFAGMLTVALPIVALVAALGAAGYFFAKWAVDGKDFADTMSRIGIILSAVWEGLSNMDNGVTTLNESTAKSLNDNGLMGAATTLLAYGYRIKRFFSGLADGFEEAFGPGGPAYEAFSFLGDAIKQVFGTMGALAGDTSTSSSDKWAAAGYAIAQTISWLVAGFAYGFGVTIHVIDYVVKALGLVIDAIQWIIEKLEKATAAFSDFGTMAKSIISLPGAALGKIFGDDDGDHPGKSGPTTFAKAEDWSGGGDWSHRLGQNNAAGGINRPSAQALADLTNPDNRTDDQRNNDSMLTHGGRGVPSPWLKSQETIASTPTDIQVQQLNELRRLNSMNVFLDGDLVGKVMEKRGVQTMERTGKMGSTQ